MKTVQKAVTVQPRRKAAPLSWDKFCDLRATYALLSARSPCSRTDVRERMEALSRASKIRQSADFFEAFSERSLSDSVGVLEVCLEELEKARVIQVTKRTEDETWYQVLEATAEA